jgi:maleylacetate reductase
MAHAAEALYARSANRLLWAIAEECIRSMAMALPRIVVTPDDPEPRADALEAAWLGGRCLAEGGSALHHRLCHILGGAFDLPHAETHTVLLPHVLAYNGPAASEAMLRLGQALDSETLKAIGMPKDGIDRAIESLLADPVWNPRPLESKPLKAMLRRAFDGARPR